MNKLLKHISSHPFYSILIVSIGVLIFGLVQAQTPPPPPPPQPPSTTAPVISSILPSSGTLNNDGFYLTVVGSKFNSSSKIKFNNTVKTTSFVSPSQLKAYIPSSDLTTPGTYNIIVENGTETSNTVTFKVNVPTPQITSIQPVSNSYSISYSTTQGFFNLTINGTGFIPPIPGPNVNSGSTVKFNDQTVITRYLSSTQLIGEIPVSNLGTAGNYTVNVTNPNPGGVSNNQTFTVITPAPTITNVAQASQAQGTPGTTITVTGTNFSAGSIARFNGTNRKTTYVSNTSLTVSLPASDFITRGYYQLNILNPDGQTSNNYQIRIYTTRYECNIDTQQCQQTECSVGDCKDICSPLDNGDITCYDYLTIINKTYDYYPYTLPGPDADFWYIISGFPAPANPWVLVETRNGWGQTKVPVFKNASYTIIQHPPDEDDWKLNSIQGAKTFNVGNNDSILAATNVGGGGTVIFTNSYIAKGKLKIVLKADGQPGVFDFLIQHSKNGSYFYDWNEKNITITTHDTASYPLLEPGSQDGEQEIELNVDKHADSDLSYLDYKIIGNLSDGWVYDSIICQREDGRIVGKRDGKVTYAVSIEPHKTTTCIFQVHQKLSTLKIITNLNGNIDKIKDASLQTRPLFSYNIATANANNFYYPLPYVGQVQITNFPTSTATTGLVPRPLDVTGPWGWGSQEISITSGTYYIQQNNVSGWTPSSATCFQVYQDGQAINPPQAPQLSYVCYNENTSFAQCAICNADWCRNNRSCNPNTVNTCNSSNPPPPSTSLAILNQEHFKIYRDNYILNAADAIASQDSNGSINTGFNFRIRFQVANTGTGPVNIARRLEFKEDLGPWTTITNNSNNVRLVDSPNFIDGDATTSRLSATGTFVAGKGKDTSADTSSMSLDKGKYTEDEYALILQASAAGHSYYFRITNAGVPFNIYSATPYISVSSLIVGDRIFVDERGYIYEKCQLGDPQNTNENNCCMLKSSQIYKDAKRNLADYGNPQSCTYTTWGLLNPLGVGGRHLSQINLPLSSKDGVVQVPIAAGGKTICIFNNSPQDTSSGGRPAGDSFEDPQKVPNVEPGL